MNSKQSICLSYSSPIAFLFSCFIIFLVTTTISVSGVGNETDYMALLQLKSMIRNEGLSSWNSSFHHCDWSGVSCGKRHRRVIALQLNSQGLQGSLSPYVGDLSFLYGFSLSNNSFEGMIPHELGRLSKLRDLDFSYNKFRGVIPSNLSYCFNIEELNLSYNKLVGSIPKEISFLLKLTYLAVDDNKLTGGISPFLGNISIESFSAKNNPLGGRIPDTVSHWKNLIGFYCGDCNLYGTIPRSLYNHSHLTHLALDENQLTGGLPLALGEMLPRLVYLQLYGNHLNGPLPPSISNCSKLELLEVHANNFRGKLTIDFAKLKYIYWISLGGSVFGFGEADDMNFIDTLTASEVNVHGTMPVYSNNYNFN